MPKHLTLFFLLFALGLLSSAINPHDYFTWILEVFPALIGAIVIFFTYKKFPLSTLTYSFILIHCYILFIGGHYTYAKVPLFDWIREAFHQTRNNYDKVGHFAQGFVPAMITRELFTRLHIVKKGIWVPILTVTVCLSISVWYEFLEWFVAVMTGESADAFLGTQGYVWDTQSDMLYAFIGAVCMVVLFSKWQDASIQKLQNIKK